MKHIKLISLLLLAAFLVGCGKTETTAESVTETEILEVAAETSVATEASPETTETIEEEPIVLPNVWDIVDNDGIEEIKLLRGLEIDDIDIWQKDSPFKEIKLYQRTIHKTLRLGTIGNVAVAEFVTNPDEYQTDYDYSADPVWNVRMEQSDSLQNNTGIEIPEDAWYAEYTLNRPNGKAVTVVCYDWPIEGDPNDTTAPIKTVELFIAYFEDTQNLYSIYTNEAVYTWNGEYWDNNMARGPYIVLSYIKDDGPNYYDYPAEYEIKAAAGKNDIRYFRIKRLSEVKTYQYVFGMTLEQWVNSEYNTDGWKFDSKDPYIVTSADGRFRLNKDDYVWRTMIG